jgi:hypothetical protein
VLEVDVGRPRLESWSIGWKRSGGLQPVDCRQYQQRDSQNWLRPPAYSLACSPIRRRHGFVPEVVSTLGHDTIGTPCNAVRVDACGVVRHLREWGRPKVAGPLSARVSIRRALPLVAEFGRVCEVVLKASRSAFDPPFGHTSHTQRIVPSGQLLARAHVELVSKIGPTERGAPSP